MAEPNQTVGEFYTSVYLQTHMQRYQAALQMAQQNQAQQMIVAQMLNEQLKILDRQITDLQGAGSSDEFNRLVKAYGLKQDVQADRARRQLAVYDQVNDIWNITPSLPTISNAGESFGNSLAAAGSIENKARRYASTVGGYSRSTDQAKAVAAATYTQFRADASRKGYGSTFTANDAKIKQAIADTMGVSVSDISTADAQKQKMIKDRLQDQGAEIVSEAQLDDVIKKAKQDVAGADDKTVSDLLTQRTAIATQQRQAIEAATASPEQTIQQARNIYRAQFAPIATQEREAFNNYLARLDPVQQMMMLGFETTTEGDVAFMKQPRQKVVKGAGAAPGDLSAAKTKDARAKLAAYDLYYAAQKDLKEGKVPSYKIHEKVKELFPNDDASQQKVLGYILRTQAIQSFGDTEKAQMRTEEIKARQDRKIARQTARAQRRGDKEANLFEKGFDAAADFFDGLFADRTALGLNPDAPGSIGEVGTEEEQDPSTIPDPPKDTPKPTDLMTKTEGQNQDVSTQEMKAEVFGDVRPGIGQVYRLPYGEKEYGYEIIGFDENDNPIGAFRGIAAKGAELGAKSSKKLTTAQQKEFMEEYKKDLEAMQKAQQQPKE